MAAIFPTCPRGWGMQALDVLNLDLFDVTDAWRNCDDIVCHGGEWLPASQVPAAQVRYELGAKVWVDYETEDGWDCVLAVVTGLARSEHLQPAAERGWYSVRYLAEEDRGEIEEKHAAYLSNSKADTQAVKNTK